MHTVVMRDASTRNDSPGEALAREVLRASVLMNGDPSPAADERARVMSVTRTELAAAVRDGVSEGLQAVLSDKDAMRDFWQQGYEQLTGHVTSGASQWVGKRILVALIAAVFVWAMSWLVRNGAIK